MITLTEKNLHEELSVLTKSGLLPKEMELFIGALISRLNEGKMGPSSEIMGYKNLLELTKKYLSDGIKLDGRIYEIMVFVPDDREDDLVFFNLVRKFPGGKLKKLSKV